MMASLTSHQLSTHLFHYAVWLIDAATLNISPLIKHVKFSHLSLLYLA